MAKLSLLPLSFLLLSLLGCCFAQLGRQQQFLWQNMKNQELHRLRAKTDCRIEKLTAQEPSIRHEAEAGVIEYWDTNNKQFECAGVAAVRCVINQKGLFVPHYNNAPQVLYVVEGEGLVGIAIPGCAETFETEIEQQQGQQQRSFFDRHQKVRRFSKGEILALPAGVTIWYYNHGNQPIITVSLLDTANEMNQLDLQFRNFYLAGNPRPGQQPQQEQEDSNIFNGLDDQLVASSFNADLETVKNLKGQMDRRGRIVKAENFNIAFPWEAIDEQQRGQQGGPRNGLEETLCTARLSENLGDPARADIYNPGAGRLATANGQTLPILSLLQLSAVRGHLYKNAILGPHWNVNAHAAIYITRGSGRMQVVGHSGNLVFDGIVKEGQMIIVPQNYVVVKHAGDQGCEWIAFKTNDNAMISPLAGRLSAFRSIPVEVLQNSYKISPEEAKNLKYNREESTLFSSETSSGQPKAMNYAWDVIRSAM